MAELSTLVLSYEDVRRQTARGARVIDIRTPQEYVYLHLVGSLPLAAPRFGFSLLSRQEIHDHDRVIIVAASPVLGHVASQEMDAAGIEVIGIFASLPRTWESHGLPVQLGELVHPENLTTYLQENPSTSMVDVRESGEIARFPFPEATHHIPFSVWPAGSHQLDPSYPIIFLSGQDQRAILCARDTMVKGVQRTGYVVGGYVGLHHPREYDPKAAARTTAHHGVFI